MNRLNHLSLAASLFALTTGLCFAQAQPPLQTQPPAPIVQSAPERTASPAPNSNVSCCGVITPQGRRMIALLDSLDVTHHWLANERVDWKTGDANHGGEYIPHDTHCSAFASALSLRLHVYLLRPPEHKTSLLASAQGRWLADGNGGWVSVSAAEAQRRANLGDFVVVNYVSPDAHKPGHIAIIRPSGKTAAQLAKDGPEITQAGGNNYADYVAAHAFDHHPGAWPNKVRYYAHPVDWTKVTGKIDSADM